MFFRFILIFVIVSYILYLITKWWIKRKLRNIEKEYEAQQQEYEDRNKKEGDVTVKPKEKEAGKNKDRDGEFVDYEEVE